MEFAPSEKVYQFIIDFSKKHWYTPSIDEIRRQFKWKSKTAAVHHIERLVKKGMIEKAGNGRIAFPKELRT